MIGTSVIKEFNEELKHFRMAFSEINDYPNNLVCKVVKLEIKILEVANTHDIKIQKMQIMLPLWWGERQQINNKNEETFEEIAT